MPGAIASGAPSKPGAPIFGHADHAELLPRKKYFLKLINNGLKAYLNGTSIIDPVIDIIFLRLCKTNILEAENFVKKIDDPFWEGIVEKYGWHRVNKACLEKM